MKNLATVLLIILSTSGFAQDKKSAPNITDAQRAQYWRAQAEAIAAQRQAEQAAAQLQKAIEAMKEACGDLQLGELAGEPVCKPKAPAPPAK